MKKETIIFNGDLEITGYNKEDSNIYMKNMYMFLRKELIKLFDFKTYNRTLNYLHETDMEPIRFNSIALLDFKKSSSVSYYLHGDESSLNKLGERLTKHIQSLPNIVRLKLDGASISLKGNNTKYSGDRPIIYEEQLVYKIHSGASRVYIEEVKNNISNTRYNTEDLNRYTKVLHSNTFIKEGIESYLNTLRLIEEEYEFGGKIYRHLSKTSELLAGEIVRLVYHDESDNDTKIQLLINNFAKAEVLHGVADVLNNFEISSNRIAKQMMLNNI